MPSLPIPSLALSVALPFANPDVEVLLWLSTFGTDWMDAVVLATPFWMANSGMGKFNKSPVDLTRKIPDLHVASIQFDPDRDVYIKKVGGLGSSVVHEENLPRLAMMQSVEMESATALTAILPVMPSLASLSFLGDSMEVLQAMPLQKQTLKELRLNMCHAITDVTAVEI